MSDDIGFPHLHGDIAWNHWLAQHIGKKNTEDFVYSFYQPFKILDDVLNELYTKRTIDTAEGSALGGCGNIVGLSRIAPNEIWLEFFGFVTQVSGRAFGVARMRHHNEAYTATNVLGDPEYRSRIKAKIWLNNGHGTAEECYAALSESLDVDIIFIIDIGNANANLYIGEIILSNDPRFHIIDEMITACCWR